MRNLLSLSLAIIGLLAPSTMASPVSSTSSAVPTASGTSNGKLVFCHFMMGIVSNRKSADDYDDDMKRAKDLGIDAFALNVGNDDYAGQQLGYAYESAAKIGMKVFISFDFNWWGAKQSSAVGSMVKVHANSPAQLKVDSKVFVSTFAGDGVDVDAIKSAAGQEIYFAPNLQPGQGDFKAIDAALNWMAWPNNGANKAPTASQNITVSDGDETYVKELGGKDYIAPVSPWFFTHFGGEVSYSKNWVFPSDLLWYNRWRQILALKPRFVEIITWNDYGESHYIGPLSSPHTDDGASKPHTGWLEMSKPFIAAYKAGASDPKPYITTEKLVYWYRPTPRDVKCDATDTTMGRPNGWETMEDQVFVVALLKSPAKVVVQSGSESPKTFQAPAGVSAWSAPMGVGKQSFKVTRGESTVLSGTSAKEIEDTCVRGIYNFNAYVGTLPAPTTVDRLQPDGYALMSQGLTTSSPTQASSTSS
ncbi:alpha-1-3-glucanase/mutanase [Penicillium capsulatum]|uniref:Alpha-1-3-glucanase/mutanase n=1 Tax=Penicillium capsulatum TaxID=69766 RepID=A0A9W9I7X8_9EURO|nr:alpha-1-3-glucanase/mutanase [Penicillium capsulatum]